MSQLFAFRSSRKELRFRQARMKVYTFPLVHDKVYSHYGSAAFPTLQKREQPKPDLDTGNVQGTPKDTVTAGNKKEWQAIESHFCDSKTGFASVGLDKRES